MIDRSRGDITFECDKCATTLETKQADFNSAWNMAKRDGWRAKKIGTVWMHECPNCH